MIEFENTADYDDRVACQNRHKDSELNFPKNFLGLLPLLLLVFVPGCEKTQTESRLAQVKTSFYTPSYYVVTHEELPIGTYSRAARSTNENRYEFITRLTMPSAHGVTLATDTVFQFQARTPNLLLSAIQTTYTVPKARPYREEQLYPFPKNRPNSNIDSFSLEEYGLSDFFGLELALMNKVVPEVGAFVTQRTLFNEVASFTTWKVSNRSDHNITFTSTDGNLLIYGLENELPHLDALNDDTGLRISHVSFEDYTTLEVLPPHVAQDLSIPVNGSINSPTTVSKLTLQFEFEDDDRGPWSSVLDAQDTLTTSTQSSLSTTTDSPMWSNGVINSQVTASLHSIVSNNVTDLNKPNQIVDELVAYVNQTITYKDWNTLQSIEATLERRIGDCTEFSQLFTALATAAGLTARTVVGLAFQEKSQTFGIHAWNEVLLNDGTVRSVDPTWNQFQTDATHLPFPPAYQHEIVRTLKKMTITVLDLSYNTSPEN